MSSEIPEHIYSEQAPSTTEQRECSPQEKSD